MSNPERDRGEGGDGAVSWAGDAKQWQDSSWQSKAAISPNSQIASELDVASVWRFDVIALAQLHGGGAELP
jgi:hypothetical protein